MKSAPLLFAVVLILFSVFSLAFAGTDQIATQNGFTFGANANCRLTDDPSDPVDSLWWTGEIEQHIFGGQSIGWTMDLPMINDVFLKIKYGLWNDPPVYIGLRINGSLAGWVLADQGYIAPGPEYAIFNITNFISAGTDNIDAVARVGGGEAVIGYIAVGARVTGQDLNFSEGLPIVLQDYTCLSAAPNPFNAQSNLSFILPQAGNISLTVFDCLGREVQELADGVFSAGQHSMVFDAGNLPGGIYFVRLTTPYQQLTQKLLLVK